MNASITRGMSLPKPAVMGLALSLVCVFGAVDYATGRELVISAFYLAPICWAAWSVSRGAGLFVAGMSTLVWLAADLAWGYPYSHPVIPYWNGFMLLLFFLVVVLSLSAFRTAHLHLEETVRSRTAALQREMEERKRLDEARMRAERLGVVGTMAAQLAHEVRNPLGAITLNLDLIQEEICDVPARDGQPALEGRALVNEMRQEVKRIQQVITDYLAFARPRNARREPLALDELVEQKLSFMRSAFEQAGVKLRTEFEPVRVEADAAQLWQAVLNLVRNSLEAMPSGGELTVSVHAEADRALLRVSDTGSGIADSQRERLFVPFFTTKASGTGLGLALVRQIVDEHEGVIECASAPEKGTTFTISLPVAGTNSENPDLEPAAARVPAIEKSGGKKVLVHG